MYLLKILTKTTFVLIILFGISCQAVAFSGEIQGQVTDGDSGDGLPFANVTIKVKAVGTYDVEVNYIGYASQITQGVVVIADKTTFLDIPMGSESEVLDEIVITEYKVPLIQKDWTSTGRTVTKEDMRSLPNRNAVNSIASTSSGVHKRGKRKNVNIKGSRSNATQYYIDGVKVRGKKKIFNREGYDEIRENAFLNVTNEPLSTFSIDVDAASYANVRRPV